MPLLAVRFVMISWTIVKKSNTRVLMAQWVGQKRYEAVVAGSSFCRAKNFNHKYHDGKS